LAIGFHHKNNKNIILQDIIKDRQITYASGTKFLGIWLDKNFTWDLHRDNLVCKLSKLCCALRTSRNLIDDNVARIMYYAYFYPVLKYGIVFWGISKNYKKVFILQKRAMRVLANVSRTTNCKPSFRASKIMTLPCMYIYEILLQFKMSMNNYKTNSMIHLHDTRQKSDLFITGHNTKLFEQSTTYSGISIYNRLAKEIKNTETLTKFKK
jgi:hypothetical protein